MVIVYTFIGGLAFFSALIIYAACAGNGRHAELNPHTAERPLDAVDDEALAELWDIWREAA